MQNLDKKYTSNKNYFVTHGGGSWYMHVTTSIYAWKNKKLVLETIFGKELFYKSMGKDYEIFFVQKNINGKHITTTETNTSAGEIYQKMAKNAREKAYREYFR